MLLPARRRSFVTAAIRFALAASLVIATSMRSAAADEVSEPPWKQLDAIARAFVTSVNSGSTGEAYGLFTPEAREDLTLEAFSAAVAAYQGPLGDLLSLQQEERGIVEEGCAQLVFLTGYDHADVRMTFQLCPLESAWKISLFETTPVKISREAVARNTIVPLLAQIGAPEPKTFRCPGIENAKADQIVGCVIDYGSSCIVTLALQVGSDGGFQIVTVDSAEACRAYFDE